MADAITFDADAALKNLAGAAKDARAQRFAKVIGQDWLRWIDQNFRAEGKEKRWKKLAESTVHGRQDASDRPLQDSGTLKQSFVQIALGPGSVTVGTRNEIAPIHEHGSKKDYPITPKGKKALAFPFPGGKTLKGGKNAGKIGLVRKFVKHPGIPQRKMLPSDRLAETLALETVEKLMAAIAKKANR